MNFFRYNATGNTFIICDISNSKVTDEEKSKIVIERVEDRDGMIFVEKKKGEFFMDYFNRDGKRAAFCGNGSRSFVKYLHDSGQIVDKVIFNSFSGYVEGRITPEGVMVKMPPLKVERIDKKGYYVTVGVPHYVIFSKDIEKIDVENEGRRLRNELDANIDFVEVEGDSRIKVRTYERGVEKETKACGTGSTASAYVGRMINNWDDSVTVIVRGGILEVVFDGNDIYLRGGVENV
ncbi:diaminopimelate epimerase [Athalassotoga saccharophila]|uniref:diaminopimelate epimerase n=1 Tax=Athalassotoga saccharophila TaxID=1441386 RepID=UPI00137AC968|nr:diaminopimelate epimerase [Athalassotoga saccharophila]BBJ28614.1 diaminopimelate epimerase [Athalassotoga saccharophila]